MLVAKKTPKDKDWSSEYSKSDDKLELKELFNYNNNDDIQDDDDDDDDDDDGQKPAAKKARSEETPQVRDQAQNTGVVSKQSCRKMVQTNFYIPK